MQYFYRITYKDLKDQCDSIKKSHNILTHNIMRSDKQLTRIIKNIFKNERVCRDIYQNRKSTGTRWLWQQNEIPLPHNNRT